MKPLVPLCRLATRFLFIGGIALASACASAETADQEVYRCNAPNGHGDGWAFLTPTGMTGVSGKISLHSADAKPGWASVAQILVHQHGATYSDDECGCNGIAVYAFKNPDHLEFFMKANGQEVPMAMAPYDTPISFMFSISPQGVMTLTLGNSDPQIKTITLHHAEHNSLEMSCSGTDVSFLNIAPL